MPTDFKLRMPQSQRSVVELHYGDEHCQVRVVDSGNNTMAMSVQAAVEACRAHARQIVFNDQFNMLTQAIADWLSEHDAKIAKAYLTVRDSGLLFLVVSKGATFDPELEDALTTLDIAVANDPDYELIDLSVHAIPNWQQAPEGYIGSFLSNKMVLKFVKNGG